MSTRRHGNRLLEDWRRERNPDGSRTPPERRDHPVTVKLPSDLLARLRAEAQASGLTLSAVVRVALDAGLPTGFRPTDGKTEGGRWTGSPKAESPCR